MNGKEKNENKIDLDTDDQLKKLGERIKQLL